MENLMANQDLSFLQQDCTLTLREGLTELYEKQPEVGASAQKVGALFVDHDATHVIFGCDTTFTGEAMLDAWTLGGTNIGWKGAMAYSRMPEVKAIIQQLVKEEGGRLRLYSKYFVTVFPKVMRVRFGPVRRLKKRWPYHGITEDMWNSPVNELREEYGIKVAR
tara:strand:- start:1168 stop:1659 length:492 start_codon:yes stop_codon:yes gene_type:complete